MYVKWACTKADIEGGIVHYKGEFMTSQRMRGSSSFGLGRTTQGEFESFHFSELHQTWYLVSPILIVLLDTNCRLWIVSPILNVNLTLFVIPRNSLGGIVDLQCYNYYYLPNVFPSKVQPFMTIFHHKLLIRKCRVLAHGWTHPSSMTIFVC